MFEIMKRNKHPRCFAPDFISLGTFKQPDGTIVGSITCHKEFGFLQFLFADNYDLPFRWKILGTDLDSTPFYLSTKYVVAKNSPAILTFLWIKDQGGQFKDNPQVGLEELRNAAAWANHLLDQDRNLQKSKQKTPRDPLRVRFD